MKNQEASDNHLTPDNNQQPLRNTTTMNTITSSKKKSNAASNKAIEFFLDIDAGAKRVKARLNGTYKSFNAEAKEIKGEVPLRNDGCFSYNKNHFYILLLL